MNEKEIIDAILEYLSLHTTASEDDLEHPAVQDNSDNFLAPTEFDYYLPL